MSRAPTMKKGKARATQSSGKAATNDKSARDPYRIVHAEFLAGAGPSGSLPPPVHVEIAFAGRSNVGKSSLINSLVERKSLVRTSSKPGSTRQINLYEARAVDGTVLHLVDLPGYGFTRRSKAERSSWAQLIEGYLRSRATLSAVVVLVDIRRGLEADDRELIDFIASTKDASRRPIEVLLVATKIDKLPRSSYKPALLTLQRTTGYRVFGYSSLTSEGRPELWRTLRKAALGQLSPEAGEKAQRDVGEKDTSTQGDSATDKDVHLAAAASEEGGTPKGEDAAKGRSTSSETSNQNG